MSTAISSKDNSEQIFPNEILFSIATYSLESSLANHSKLKHWIIPEYDDLAVNFAAVSHALRDHVKRTVKEHQRQQGMQYRSMLLKEISAAMAMEQIRAYIGKQNDADGYSSLRQRMWESHFKVLRRRLGEDIKIPMVPHDDPIYQAIRGNGRKHSVSPSDLAINIPVCMFATAVTLFLCLVYLLNHLISLISSQCTICRW